MFNLLNVEAGFTNIFDSMSLFPPQEQRDRKHYPRRTEHKCIKPYLETDSINIEIHMHDSRVQLSAATKQSGQTRKDTVRTVHEL